MNNKIIRIIKCIVYSLVTDISVLNQNVALHDFVYIMFYKLIIITFVKDKNTKMMTTYYIYNITYYNLYYH